MQGGCPDQWTSIAGNCYQFLPEKLSWDDAEAACKDLQGRMLEIESEEQNEAIHKEALNRGLATAWLGLGDAAKEGEYVWGSGKTLSYTNWAPMEPRNYKGPTNPEGEDCVLMNIKDGIGYHKGKPWTTPKKWNDDVCSVKSNVICEQ